MSVSRRLHEAEEHGAKAVHLAAKRVKAAIQDISTGIFALHAHRADANSQPASSHAGPEQQRDGTASAKERTGIVSVNGRDVGQMRCTGARRNA